MTLDLMTLHQKYYWTKNLANYDISTISMMTLVQKRPFSKFNLDITPKVKFYWQL